VCWGETGKTTVFSCCKTAVDKSRSMHGSKLYVQADFIKIRKTLSAQSINQAIYLSQGNAAVLVPAVIINLTRRGGGGIGKGGARV
jgi:hypothetical protein